MEWCVASFLLLAVRGGAVAAAVESKNRIHVHVHNLINKYLTFQHSVRKHPSVSF